MKRLIRVAGVGLFFAATGAMAGTSGDCELDQMMTSARQEMDKMAVGIYDTNVSKPMSTATSSAPTVKDASCLPILDQLDQLMRMRIPSMGGAMGGIMTKIRDMACSTANGYLKQLSNRAQINVSDPLGVASVGIGATTDGSGGIQTDTYDFGKVVEDAATSATGTVLSGAKSQAGQVVNQLPGGVQNRTPRVETEVRKGVNDAINGL
ncbi:hypothetical protein [Pseudomonas sp.]|uniref:hypothetical protein n=1 Tax=Pseudomonas sp. TaxID=306 RepID=UPI00290C4926|nr:hypothetical protein [Pseudomonas sp.]MDU4254471.1 hypothetical protein [Pseudomonas sp.]